MQSMTKKRGGVLFGWTVKIISRSADKMQHNRGLVTLWFVAVLCLMKGKKERLS